MKTDSIGLYIVGGAVTLAGGFFVRNFLANKTRRIKDLRKKVDGLVGEIDAVEDLAMTYFLRSGNDEASQGEGLKIKSKLKRIAAGVNQIYKDPTVSTGHRNVGLLTRLKNFRQAVTLEDFDSVERSALKASDTRFSQISDAAAALKDALEEIYGASK